MRSVWKSDFPPAVRVVAKNVRADPVAFAGSDGREGFDIAGAKALHLIAVALARLKSCPDTSCRPVLALALAHAEAVVTSPSP